MSEDKAMLVKMAFLYVQSAEWYKAIEEYKKLIILDPEDAHVYNMMGDAYAKKQDDADALQSYLKSKELYEKQGQTNKITSIERKISKLSPERMDLKQRQFFQSVAKTQEAERLAGEGNLDEAIALYQQFIAAEPINFSYREKLANLFLEHAQITEAVAQLKAVADFHLAEGRLDAAQAYAGKISLMDPEGLDTLRLLAALAEKKGDQAAAAGYYGKLAQASFDLFQYEEAKAAIDSAVKAGHPDLKLLLAKTLQALKKPQEAKQQFELLLKADPENENLLEPLLNLAEETKDWNGAYTHITALAAKHPEDIKLKSRMARILIQVGKRPEAKQVYLTLAAAALKENNWDGVFGHFDSILVLEPDNIEILKKKAEIYLKLGKKQEVIDTYKQLQAVFNQKKMTEEAKRVGLILVKLSGLKG